MKFRLCLYLLILLSSLTFETQAWAQDTGTLKGKVTSSETGEPLIGVNIFRPDLSGTTTDLEGNYELQLPVGTHFLTLRFVGFEQKNISVTIKAKKTTLLNVELTESYTHLDAVVISAGRFEQKLGDVTVSMEVIQPDLIENKNVVTIENALDQVPGVTLNDGQASIRGGSGFAFGAGTRVAMLLDGLPILTADAGDVKWNALPIENLSQIEIIKGASSVLFGSSALNGVINMRSGYPKDKPETKISFYHGIYDSPVRRDSTGSRTTNGQLNRPLKWWENAPYYSGLNFFHSQKVRQLDITVGGAYYNDLGYREGEFERRGRMNANLRYRSKQIEGLSYGVNVNSQFAAGRTFFIWLDADSGALRPRGGIDPNTTTLTEISANRTNVDPYIEYWDPKGNKHSLRTRFYHTENKTLSNQDTKADLYYSEYQFQKRFEQANLTLTSGLVASASAVRSQLYGTHDGTNLAFFSQLDKQWGKLKLSAGLRGEYFRIDTFESESNFNSLPFQPVFRFGSNYQLAEETYLRASFGQGFRFPTIAEKFITAQVGPLQFFSNPDLEPETGWNAEFGVKQGFKIGKWYAYADVAAFIQQYENMMEFTFGVFNPDSITVNLDPNDEGFVVNWAGFQAQNVESAQITGVDLSLQGRGKIFRDLELTLLAGYTYMNPISLNNDSAYLTTFSDSTSNILKYRFHHLIKGDVQLQYKKWATGLSVRYNSFVINIDRAFQELEIPVQNGFINLGDAILPGIEAYRNRNNKGDVVFDYRLSYELTTNSKMAMVVNNLFNREYMGRPGDIQPPRTMAVNYVLHF